jgi:hypothetical protein
MRTTNDGHQLIYKNSSDVEDQRINKVSE